MLRAHLRQAQPNSAAPVSRSYSDHGRCYLAYRGGFTALCFAPSAYNFPGKVFQKSRHGRCTAVSCFHFRNCIYVHRPQGFYIEFDTPYYPIVGAMSVATFSYYFSSFQYSITLMHELAAATALVFSMFPVWTLLTMRVNSLVKYETSTADDKGIRRIVVEVILMLLISLLWTLHSSVYRTIGYRAAWITAYNKEKERGWTGDAMRRMWILAGAQGHPTWRTPTGQSFGLYLAVLAWSISITVRHDLRCDDDLVLFHLLLWGSPVLLTLAVLASQLTITLRASSKFRGTNKFMSVLRYQNVFTNGS